MTNSHYNVRPMSVNAVLRLVFGNLKGWTDEYRQRFFEAIHDRYGEEFDEWEGNNGY